MAKKLLTLCIVHEHPRLLLGMKKRGFGEGRWNGFGGKVGPGETVEDAAARELREESGLSAHSMTRVGIIEFEFAHTPDETLEVHIFRVEGYGGEPTETEEMSPQWFMIDEIPFKDMWPDDRYWFPLFLKGRKFKGRFLFGEADAILENSLEEVSSL